MTGPELKTGTGMVTFCLFACMGVQSPNPVSMCWQVHMTFTVDVASKDNVQQQAEDALVFVR